MKYNFKIGEKVQIYRKPVSNLGAKALPDVGSIGEITDFGCSDSGIFLSIPYVRVKFYEEKNNPCMSTSHNVYWAIPCSCLKRIKEEIIIKVPANIYLFKPICESTDGKYCEYFSHHDCSTTERFPACSKDQIVYLKVKR